MSKMTITSLTLALAVGCGAFGAHALKATLSDHAMDIWEKAVFYHFIHGVAALLCLLLQNNQFVDRKTVMRAWLSLMLGILLFSGSLYLLALTGIKTFGAITPVGGVLFIASFLLIAWGTRKVV